MLSAGWRFLKLTLSGVGGRRHRSAGRPVELRGPVVRECQLQPRTRELYESLLRNHIRPYLGDRSLDKINS
jgi:hypothetical protein